MRDIFYRAELEPGSVRSCKKSRVSHTFTISFSLRNQIYMEYFYIMNKLAMTTLFFMLSSFCACADFEPVDDDFNFSDYIGDCRIGEGKMRWYLDQINHSNAQALYCLEEAEDLCWYMPDVNAQEAISDAILCAIPSMRGNVQSKLCTSALIVLAIYAKNCFTTSCKIHSLLRDAEYHARKSESLQNELIRLHRNPQMIE